MVSTTPLGGNETKFKKERIKMKNTKNKTAKILKVYAIVNALGGLIITWWLWWNLPGYIADIGPAMFLVLTAVTSFLVYTLGEIVDLLAQIRDNTVKEKQLVK